MGFYFLIGLIYAIINGAVRQIDTDGDWFLAVVWIILWPIGILSLIAAFIQKKVTK